VASVIAIWGGLSIIFVLLSTNGNPAALMVGPGASSAELQSVTHLYGYDQPMYVQYLVFFRRVFTANFPTSLRYDTSSTMLVADRIPATMLLGATSLALAALVGGISGYLSVYGRRPSIRWLPLTLVETGGAIPPILLALLLVVIFSLKLHWLPSAGYGTVAYLIMPVLTLSTLMTPPIARVFRLSILELVDADHVRAALARGVPPRRVRWRHVIANALSPVLNQLGVQAGVLFGGAVVVETIFNWPGVGNLAVNSLLERDYPVVLACATFMIVGFVLVNLVVDILAAVIDPRVRVQ
jgi:peptide/nickel transport system permease protein